MASIHTTPTLDQSINQPASLGSIHKSSCICTHVAASSGNAGQSRPLPAKRKRAHLTPRAASRALWCTRSGPMITQMIESHLIRQMLAANRGPAGHANCKGHRLLRAAERPHASVVHGLRSTICVERYSNMFKSHSSILRSSGRSRWNSAPPDCEP